MDSTAGAYRCRNDFNFGCLERRLANIPRAFAIHLIADPAGGGSDQYPVKYFADHNPVTAGDWRCLHKRLGCNAVRRRSGRVESAFVEILTQVVGLIPSRVGQLAVRLAGEVR